MPSDIRLTKIVATLGPATESEEMLEALLRAGCDVVRLNASHNTTEWREATLQRLRAVAERLGRHVAVMLDLAGPKIRVDRLSAEPLLLADGATVRIARHELPPEGSAFSATWPEMIDDCRPGDRILLDDGAMALRVRERLTDELRCEVFIGGSLARRKGINLPDTSVSAPALTEKDVGDLAWGAQKKVDYVALSFVRRPEDLRDLRHRLEEAGSSAGIVAKIEKPEAVAHIKEVVAASDAVMVARGDLGVEMDVAEVPLIQKRLIRVAVEARRPVIVATQMLQTMITSPYPTRAETSDVANGILDGTDAVMLSGETAVGRHPVEAVRVMDRIANLTEDHAQELGGWSYGRRVVPAVDSGDQSAGIRAESALADGAVVIAQDAKAKAIVVLTHSGATALAVSNNRPDLPIVAISDRLDTCRRMALYRGVLPIHHPELIQPGDLRRKVSESLAGRNWVERGALVVIISGQFPGKSGTSDMLQVFRLGS